jgi:ATP-dependent Clp protease protease subunit
MNIQIDGIIGYDVTAREIRQALSESGGDVELIVNSPGGSVTEGVAIYNAIRDYRREGNTVNARVVGLAASMASYIPLAADTVTVEDNTIFMIHEPSTIAIGRKADFERTVAVLEGVSQTLARRYAEKTGKTVDEIRALMNEETYLFGDEIVAEGFADSVEPAGDGPENADEAVALARAAIADAEAKLSGDREDMGQLAAMLGDMPKAQKQESKPVVDGSEPAAKAETKKGGVMDFNTLKNEHPAVFAEAVQAGHAEGVEAERARVAELRSYIEADPDNGKLAEVINAAISEGKTVAEVNGKIQVAIRDGGKLDGENPPAVETAADEMAGLDAEDREAMRLMGMSAAEYKKYTQEVK